MPSTRTTYELPTWNLLAAGAMADCGDGLTQPDNDWIPLLKACVMWLGLGRGTCDSAAVPAASLLWPKCGTPETKEKTWEQKTFNIPALLVAPISLARLVLTRSAIPRPERSHLVSARDPGASNHDVRGSELTRAAVPSPPRPR